MPVPATRDRKDRRLVLAIAVFKFAKCLLMLAVATGAFALLGHDIPRLGRSLVSWLELDSDGELVRKILERLPLVTDDVLGWLGGGALASATLYGFEGYGLLRGRLWGEWLTIAATASFVPFEVYGLLRNPTGTKVGAIVLNVAVVAFLVARRMRAA